MIEIQYNLQDNSQNTQNIQNTQHTNKVDEYTNILLKCIDLTCTHTFKIDKFYKNYIYKFKSKHYHTTGSIQLNNSKFI